MNNVNAVKQKAIDHMVGMDLSGMSMQDVALYVSTIQTLNMMEKSDYTDRMLGLLSGNVFSGVPLNIKEKEE